MESRRRKEQLMNNKIVYAKSCIGCKIGAGVLFAGFGGFHAYRVITAWKFFPVKDRLFNVFAVSCIFLLSAANFNAAYETYLGKTLQLEEVRPNIFHRLLPSNPYLTP